MTPRSWVLVLCAAMALVLVACLTTGERAPSPVGSPSTRTACTPGSSNRVPGNLLIASPAPGHAPMAGPLARGLLQSPGQSPQPAPKPQPTAPAAPPAATPVVPTPRPSATSTPPPAATQLPSQPTPRPGVTPTPFPSPTATAPAPATVQGVPTATPGALPRSTEPGATPIEGAFTVQFVRMGAQRETLTVRSDGVAQLDRGGACVEDRVPATMVTRLRSAMTDAGFLNLADDYAAGAPQIGESFSVVLSGQRTKSVIWHDGVPIPSGLVSVRLALDGVARHLER